MYEGSPPHEPGTVLKDKYEVQDLLAKGSSSRVYKARRTADGQSVAIKELFMQDMEPDRMEQTFLQFDQEGALLQSLHHQGLVEVLDCFSSQGRRYIVMALLEGDLLDKRLQDGQSPADVPTVLEWVLQVCDVLVYLHEHDPVVVLRDLHPGNIVLSPDKKRIHLIDLGVAKTMTGKATILRGVGTPGFVPIEQLTGGVDQSADLYALGATLYALLTHQVPVAFGLRLLEDPLQPPDTVNPAIPKPLSDLVMKCMARRKQDRPESVRVVRDELKQILEPLRPKPAAVAQGGTPAAGGKAKAGCLPLLLVGILAALRALS